VMAGTRPPALSCSSKLELSQNHLAAVREKFLAITMEVSSLETVGTGTESGLKEFCVLGILRAGPLRALGCSCSSPHRDVRGSSSRIE
jgi:hypothetical protein